MPRPAASAFSPPRGGGGAGPPPPATPAPQGEPHHRVLIHAAAGGIGLLACQWARALGAHVIGTVGSKAKADLALANGCDHVILYNDEDFAARVKQISRNELCDVVYDGVGKTTFPGSLSCLKPRGMF